MGTVGFWIFSLLSGPSASVSSSSGLRTSLARAYNVDVRTLDWPVGKDLAVDATHTKATIFAPSVKLPAPSVRIRSAFAFRASSTISRTSDQSVWLCIPTRHPTTLSGPSAAFKRPRESVFRANEPEQITYTREAWKVSVTCRAAAAGKAMPYESSGRSRPENAGRTVSVMIILEIVKACKRDKSDF
jgi:hypothetical protein